MNFFKITFGFMSVFSMVSAAFAVTARPGIVNTASVISASGRRMPSMNQMLTASSTTTGAVTAASSSTVTMDEVECVEAYTECLSDSDSCGEDFSECTTNVLFHGQMPDCASTLMQCPASAIVKLFGSGAGITNLSNVAEYNDDNEIVRYTYPMAGTILDQKIEAARIENMYDDQTCVKRYTNCLKRDDVCGENFELCTSKNSFKKQALNCDSHLVRCQMSGVRKMFGDKVQSKSMNRTNGLIEGIGDLSTVGGSIAVMVDEGADYVALNAVSSCYKKIDACILAACDKNPLRCIEGTSLAAISEAEKVGAEAGSSDFKTMIKATENDSALTSSHINRYLRSECADAIGGFEACHITYMGAKPKAKDLADRDIIEEVFNLAHNDRKSILASKIQGRMQEFDKSAKDACRETIRTCAMRTCGGGIGSACYSLVYGSGKSGTINAGDTYDGIKNACSAIVNTDKNCVYAHMYSANGKDVYSYSYINGSAFDTLFPEEAGTDGYQSSNDPIGVVGELNALLATSYNDAAIAQMRIDCEDTAKSCVRALCGSEYEACYRNRNDIESSLTQSADSSFDKSMNKVGGVLDYTVVLGLCADTVKNDDSCKEHLAIQKAKTSTDNDTVAGWGMTKGSGGTVRDGWFAAGAGSNSKIQAEDENNKKLCYNKKREQGVCGENDGSGSADGIYKKSDPVLISAAAYGDSQAVNTLFKELVYDLEKEAQAKYNAKLTKLQNMCLASNGGNGAMGSKELSSIYRWVKLTEDTVPQNYSNVGLVSGDIKESNDLYGSFCAVKVELKSDDRTIRDALTGSLKKKNEGKDKDDDTIEIDLSESSYRYFAIGDPAVCGGWLTGSDLESIASVVEANARAQAKDGEVKGMRGWMTALGAVGLGTGGMLLGDAIEKGSIGSSFSGITNTKKLTKDKKSKVDSCKEYLTKAKKAVSDQNDDNLTKVRENIDEAEKLLVEYNVTESFDWALPNSKSSDHDCAAGTDAINCWQGKAKAYEDASTDEAKKKAAAAAAAAAADLRLVLTSSANINVCNQIAVKAEGENPDNGKKWVGKLAGGLGGAAIGGGLAYAVTDAVLDAKLDKAGNEAYNAFMETVGSKIHCYIGTQQVASFGQIIETSME